VTIPEIVRALLDVVRLAHRAKYTRLTERKLELLLLGLFQERFGHMSREQHIRLHGSTRPSRIDLRYGTSNPVVFELAVRPKSGGQQLEARQNKTELAKLTRVRTSETRSRVLLLVDLHRDPIHQTRLRALYLAQNAGRGRFKRHRVRVIYVHRELQYDFPWNPFAA